MKQISFSHRYPAFTLIELLLYSSLVTIIVGSFVATSYYSTRANERDRELLAVIENQRFLNYKLDWLLQNVAASTILPAANPASYLEVTQSNQGRFMLDQNGTTLRLRFDSNNDGAITGADTATALTNNHVQVSNLVVTRSTSNDRTELNITANLAGRYSAMTLKRTYYLR